MRYHVSPAVPAARGFSASTDYELVFDHPTVGSRRTEVFSRRAFLPSTDRSVRVRFSVASNHRERRRRVDSSRQCVNVISN